jgi:hypothetical protein
VNRSAGVLHDGSVSYAWRSTEKSINSADCGTLLSLDAYGGVAEKALREAKLLFLQRGVRNRILCGSAAMRAKVLILLELDSPRKS